MNASVLSMIREPTPGKQTIQCVASASWIWSIPIRCSRSSIATPPNLSGRLNKWRRADSIRLLHSYRFLRNRHSLRELPNSLLVLWRDTFPATIVTFCSCLFQQSGKNYRRLREWLLFGRDDLKPVQVRTFVYIPVCYHAVSEFDFLYVVWVG